MALTKAVGMDGAIAFPTNFFTTLDFWSAAFDMDIFNVSAFGDTWRAFRGGLRGGRGSATGTPHYGAASTNPGVASMSRDPSATDLTLTVAPGCTYAGKALISNIGHSNDVNGPARVMFDFLFSGAVTVVWAVS